MLCVSKSFSVSERYYSKIFLVKPAIAVDFIIKNLNLNVVSVPVVVGKDGNKHVFPDLCWYQLVYTHIGYLYHLPLPSLHLHPQRGFQPCSLSPATTETMSPVIYCTDDVSRLYPLNASSKWLSLWALTSDTFFHMLCKSSKTQLIRMKARLLRGRSVTAARNPLVTCVALHN